MNITENIKKRLEKSGKTVLKKYMLVLLPVSLLTIIAINIVETITVSKLHTHNTKLMYEQTVILQGQSLRNTFLGYKAELNMLLHGYSGNVDKKEFLSDCEKLLEGSPLPYTYLSLSTPVDGITYKTTENEILRNFKDTKAFHKIILKVLTKP